MSGPMTLEPLILPPEFADLAEFAIAVEKFAWDTSEAEARPVTVGEVADHFSCGARDVIRAVRWHYWMYLDLPDGTIAELADVEPDDPITFDDPRRLLIGHEGE